ncbi:hypothetical protein HZS_3678, partial [Henneguya salminicola]
MMNKTRLLYIFYFLIKFLLVLEGFSWAFFHNWYVFKGTNSEGNEVYHSIGPFKVCTHTRCHFNTSDWSLLRALQILCFFYLFSIIQEIIQAFISVRCFSVMLPAMILSIQTFINFIPINIIAFYLYFLNKGVQQGFTYLDDTIFFTNTVNFSFWNIINLPITLLNFLAALFLFLIRRERQINIPNIGM